MSTSYLVKKMIEVSESSEYGYVISAHGIYSVNEEGKDADIILLAPQVAYMESRIDKGIKHKVSIIDSIDYGRVNAENILNSIRSKKK